MLSKIDFVNQETRRSLLKLFVPLALAMLLTMAYSSVDSLWVGNLLGESGISALTASTAIVLIMNSLSMGFGNGVTVMIAQLVGAGKKKEINGAVAMIMTASVIISSVVCIAGEILAGPILSVMGTPQAVLPDAVSYLKYYLVGNVALFLYMQFTSVFRAFGDSMFQMKGMLMTVILNAVLDPLFIRVWGFDGVAIATVLSEFACLLYAVIYYNRKKLFSFDFGAMKIADVKEMLRLCIPTAIQQIMPAVSSAVMITFVNPFGVTALAGYGVVRNLELIMFMPTNAMAMTVTSIVGQCHGAGRSDRAADYLKEGILAGGIMIMILTVLVIGNCNLLSAGFGQGSEVADIVASFLHIVGIGYLLYLVTSCIQGYATGIGKSGIAMLLLILYYIAYRIPAAAILERYFGLSGIWMGILASHVLAFISAIIIYRSFRRVLHWEVSFDH